MRSNHPCACRGWVGEGVGEECLRGYLLHLLRNAACMASQVPGFSLDSFLVWFWQQSSWPAFFFKFGSALNTGANSISCN